MESVAEALARPLSVVDALFAQHVAKGQGPAAEWGEKAAFAQAFTLSDEESLGRIPCLSEMELTVNVQPFSLVRFRGLVQDVFEHEVYAALYEEFDPNSPQTPPRVATTKYRDVVEAAPGKELRDLGAAGMGGRGVCYCVPIPGEAAWSREAATEWSRSRGGAEWCDRSAAAALTTAAGAPAARKRARDDDVDMGDAPAPQQARPAEPAAGTGANVPAAPSGHAAPQGAASGGEKSLRNADEFGLNFPLPWEERHGCGRAAACILKLYDEHMESLRLCDTVEVIGVLCLNPEMADFDTTPLADSGIGRDARQPSTSLVPRLHAIHVRKLPYYHPMAPYSPDFLTEARLAQAWQAQFGAPSVLTTAREAALQALTRHLGGDALTAEYVLMQLVSRAFGKTGEQALGSFPLSIAKWPKTGYSVQDFANALSDLVPRSVFLALTVGNLNTQRWRPRKDYIANRLVASQLQLSAGTLAIFDETGMAEGNLTSDGVRNLTAVGNLALQQQLTCDFSYDMPMPLEVTCLFVSDGKSMIRDVNVRVPLQPADCAGAVPSAPDAGALVSCRMLVALLTRQPHALKMQEEMRQKIAADFSTVRQGYEVAPELCHSWVTLARAKCLLHGEDELTMDRWKAVFDMECERLRRCKEAGILER